MLLIMTRGEDREFQIELLKVQLKHQDFTPIAMALISFEISILVPLATTYLALGWSLGVPLFIITSVASLVALIVAVYLTLGRLNRTLERRIIESVERDLQSIRERFIEAMQNSETFNQNDPRENG